MFRLFDAANLLCEDLADEQRGKALSGNKFEGKIMRRSEYETNQSILATPRREDQVSKMQEENNELQQAYMEKEKEIQKEKAEREKLEIEKEQLENKVKELQDLVDKLNGEILSQKDEMKEDNELIEKVKSELQSQIEKKGTDLDKALMTISELDKALKEQRNQRINLQEECAEVRHQRLSLEQKTTDMAIQIGNLQSQQTASDFERQDAAQVFRMRERELRIQNEQLQGEIRELQAMIEQDKERYDGEIKGLSQKLREVRELVSAQEQVQHNYKKISSKIQYLRDELRHRSESPFPSAISPVHGRVLNMSEAFGNEETQPKPPRIVISPQKTINRMQSPAFQSPEGAEGIADDRVLDQALLRIRQGDRQIEQLQNAINQLQGERQREYWSGSASKMEEVGHSPSTPRTNMIEYFRAEIESLRQKKVQLEMHAETVENDNIDLRKRLERYDLEGTQEAARNRRKAFNNLGDILQVYVKQQKWSEADFSLNLLSVLEVGAGVIKDLQNRLADSMREVNDLKYQLTRAKEQLGSDLSAAQSKAQYNENVINILERNYKQEVDALQRERDMLQRRATTTSEQSREIAVQLESLKIENLRQTNEIKFLRKEREEAFKRAQQSIGLRAKEQLEIQVKQAKEEGSERNENQGQDREEEKGSSLAMWRYRS